MRKLIQTRKDNCLQTCVAILLDREPEQLPLQQNYSGHDDFVKALRVYLDKHFGLTYAEVPVEQFELARVTAKQALQLPHIMIGPCSRTSPENGEAWHSVIGRDGEMIWDVSDAQSGLTEVKAWAF